MNGRIYDPLLGRFLSADLAVQFPNSLQSYNRYSYVRNNPLTCIDPTGWWEASVLGVQVSFTGTVLSIGSFDPVKFDFSTANANANIKDVVTTVANDFKSGDPIKAMVDLGATPAEMPIGSPGGPTPAAVTADGAVVASERVSTDARVLQVAPTVDHATRSDVKSDTGGKIESQKPAASDAKEPHGNSKDSPKPQHRYEIVHNESGDVVKTGISGQTQNENGSSPRANPQVNTLNKAEGEGTYSARIAETNIPGRAAGLKNEAEATNKLAGEGNSLRLQQRPKPQPKPPAKPGDPPQPADGN
jgi:hypothetical protein